jgi:hypothetical protein
VASHAGFLSGRLVRSNEGTWVLFHHDSSAAPQTVQTASPVCGTKNFISVRLYSAPLAPVWRTSWYAVRPFSGRRGQGHG